MLAIKRVSILAEGAFGVLMWHGIPISVTLEHTYLLDGAHRTKIPPGVYECVRGRFHKGGYDTWHIHGGVISLDRQIKFHKGNTEEDSDGCPIVGEQFGLLKGKQAVLRSGEAFQELMTLTSEYDIINLTVVNV